MTCPKCHGEMRQYERSGVVVDQCGECRGIYLDRGELEKLFEAEANWNKRNTAPGAPGAAPAPPGAGYPPPPPPPPPAPAHHHQPGYAPGHVPPPPPPPPPAHGYPPAPVYGQPHYGYHGHYRNKRHKHKSFLNELFD